MKQHILETDLLELTEEQKQKLRYLWVPKERDLAVAYICKDVESEKYDAIVFTVGRVESDEFETEGRYNSIKKHFSMTLRSLRLIDDNFYNNLDKDDDVIEDLILEYQPPDDFFSFENCLPLLNIGQMIELLCKHYFSVFDFFITYNRTENKYQIGKRSSTYNEQYNDFESDELCDVLWEALKTLLE